MLNTKIISNLKKIENPLKWVGLFWWALRTLNSDLLF